MNTAKYVFPAVRGVQATREYYISMVPLDCVTKIFTYNDESIPPEIRSQRILNKSRIPEMSDYIVTNQKSYVFSAITASIDGEIEFSPISEANKAIGHISIDMASRLLINDGQHRRAAIELAIKKNPGLKHEHIAVVFYHDLGLKHAQQMFSDLNKHAVRPTKSLNILYDNRNEFSLLVKDIITSIPVFQGQVDMENTSIPNRSKALFTLSAIYKGTEELLEGLELCWEEKQAFAIKFWGAVAKQVPLWQQVKQQRIKASVVRKEYLCSLSLTIVGFGLAGNRLYRAVPARWESYVEKISAVDWSKSNKLWRDTIVVGGSVVSSRTTQQIMADILSRVFMDELVL